MHLFTYEHLYYFSYVFHVTHNYKKKHHEEKIIYHDCTLNINKKSNIIYNYIRTF